ncbi:MAG: sn-glycerol-3-phosphate ABC transporter permease UgpE [Cytophagales bacterium]|nr:sn-glycerol-3-phosphate ABC transporter permease UgpE [Cytophagales bacterium]
MVERKPILDWLSHGILIVGVLIVALPIWIAFVGSTHTLDAVITNPMPIWPGGELWHNYWQVLNNGGTSGTRAPVLHMLGVSFAIATLIAIGKIFLALLSAFALVYFRFRFKQAAFWLIFITLMLPVEVRISPTYQVVSSLGMLNSYAGLTLPLLASATATFLFRQFFMTVPDELVEASRMDGASPMRFFWDVLLPLSKTNIAALFVIMFIYGWNQYLWPLLVSTEEKYYPIVIGIKQMIAAESQVEWQLVMATAMLALLPPVLVVIAMQRWFVRGLVDAEK